MADNFSLVQKIAEAGGNASGYCSYKEARQFLAMFRALQEHDAKEAVERAERQPENKVHPWDGLLD